MICPGECPCCDAGSFEHAGSCYFPDVLRGAIDFDIEFEDDVISFSFDMQFLWVMEEWEALGGGSLGIGDIKFVKLGDVAVVWGDDDGIKGEFEGGTKFELGDVHLPAVVEMEVRPVPSFADPAGNNGLPDVVMVSHAYDVVLFLVPGDVPDNFASGDIVVSSGDKTGEREVGASAFYPDGEEIRGELKVCDKASFFVNGMDLPVRIGSFGPTVLKGDVDSWSSGLERPSSFVEGAQGIAFSRVVKQEDEEVVWSEEADISEFHLVETDDHGVTLEVAFRVVEEDVIVPPFSSTAFMKSFVGELQDVST